MSDNEPKTEFIAKLPEGVECVGMAVINGTLYLALSTGVYRLEEAPFGLCRRFVPVPIEGVDG